MPEAVRISARDLGRIRMDDFCPRCFWLTLRFPLSNNHPFRSPMPGLVSTLDSYIKRVVDATFRQTGQLPTWLMAPLAEVFGNFEVKDTIPVERWEEDVSGFTLVGEPDALWRLHDDSLFIADYKVARITEAQEKLFPLYETQLKAYAYLAERKGYKVKGLALVYFEPQSYTNQPKAAVEISAGQLTLHFSCSIKQVEDWSSDEVEEMVREVGELLNQPKPPAGKQNCPGCQALEGWMNRIREAIS